MIISKIKKLFFSSHNTHQGSLPVSIRDCQVSVETSSLMVMEISFTEKSINDIRITCDGVEDGVATGQNCHNLTIRIAFSQQMEEPRRIYISGKIGKIRYMGNFLICTETHDVSKVREIDVLLKPQPVEPGTGIHVNDETIVLRVSAHLYELKSEIISHSRGMINMYPPHLQAYQDRQNDDGMQVLVNDKGCIIWNITRLPMSAHLKPQVYINAIERLAALKHPNIIPIGGIIIQGSSIYMARSASSIHSPNLQQVLGIVKFSMNQIKNIAYDVLVAISATHTENIAHCSICPANIYTRVIGGWSNLSDAAVTGQVFLGGYEYAQDCSYVHRLVAGTTQSKLMNSSHASPAHASPEILDPQGHFTELCDVWSLGVVILELLNGESMFAGHSNAESRQAILTFNFDTNKSVNMNHGDTNLVEFLQHIFVPEKDRWPASRLIKLPWFTSKDQTSNCTNNPSGQSYLTQGSIEIVDLFTKIVDLLFVPHPTISYKQISEIWNCTDLRHTATISYEQMKTCLIKSAFFDLDKIFGVFDIEIDRSASLFYPHLMALWKTKDMKYVEKDIYKIFNRESDNFISVSLTGRDILEDMKDDMKGYRVSSFIRMLNDNKIDITQEQLSLDQWMNIIKNSEYIKQKYDFVV